MDTLKDIFVSYEIAEKLKEIGFDEECIAVYSEGKLHILNPFDNVQWVLFESDVMIPTYEQVFKWFREKGIVCSIIPTYLGDSYFFEVFKRETNTRQRIYIGNNFKTYEQAQEQLILKLIEIYKDEQINERKIQHKKE